MSRVIDLSAKDARAYFLKQSSYMKEDVPEYVSFEPLLLAVEKALKGSGTVDYGEKPWNWAKVNYELVANKDGRFDWRPFELIHPALYVTLVNLICGDENWKLLQVKAAEYSSNAVECCGWPVQAEPEVKEADNAEQVRSWWQAVEQKSLALSLEYSHIVHTDVTNCYGTLYTHSISWALHGFQEAKDGAANKLLGGKIDDLIRAGRYGQTNGIPQGSRLMDLIAEFVLGYVDQRITVTLAGVKNFKILRFRDDFRIFTNDDATAELVLKVVADELRHVGMRLGNAKTYMSTNVVEASVKKEKLTAINLQDLGATEAKTIQKQLLRIHSFCRQHPHSGQLKRLLTDLHRKLVKIEEAPDDLAVQVAIATDIGFISPSSFPAVAAILSHLIALSADLKEKEVLWNCVREKMRRVPKNGYLDIWLQRVIQASQAHLDFSSEESICKLVKGEAASLWVSDWVTSQEVKKALDVKQIVVGKVQEQPETVGPDEIALFAEISDHY